MVVEPHISCARAWPNWAHDVLSFHSRMGFEEKVLGKGLGREQLSYEVCIEMIEGTDHDCGHFVVDRDPAALAATCKGTLYDDLVTILDGDTADHFQGACIVFQEKLEGWLALFVRDRLDAADLAHDDHFLPIIVLGVRDDLGQFEQFSGSRNRQNGRDESENHPKRGV